MNGGPKKFSLLFCADQTFAGISDHMFSHDFLGKRRQSAIIKSIIISFTHYNWSNQTSICAGIF